MKTLAKIASRKYAKSPNPHRQKLAALRDVHEEQRCFIIGTGPSLNNTNLELLDRKICFGLNTLYKIKTDCDYWVVSDLAVWQKQHPALRAEVEAKVMFLTELIAYHYAVHSDSLAPRELLVKYLGSANVFNTVSKNAERGTYSGGSVAIHAIQLAYYMGFTEIYLVGCDTDYTGLHHFDGSTCAEIGVDINFEKKYDYVTAAYTRCKKELVDDKGPKHAIIGGLTKRPIVTYKHPCTIYNATVGGRLEVFPRVRLEDIV